MPPSDPTPKPRAKRAKSRRTTIPEGFKRGMWHPELVGRPFYPKTQEAWQANSDRCRAQVIRLHAEGKITTKGIPDGWGRRRIELNAIRDAAAVEAKELVKRMTHAAPIEDPRAEEALEDAVAMIRACDPETGQKVYAARERLQASRLLLDFLKIKPVSRVSAEVSRAEDWLGMLAAQAL